MSVPKKQGGNTRNAKAKANRAIRRMMRHAEAEARESARRARSTTAQLALLRHRPGEATRERKRLELRLDHELAESRHGAEA